MSEHRTKSMPITVFFWSIGNDLAGTKHMGDGCFRTSDFSVVFYKFYGGIVVVLMSSDELHQVFL